MAVIRVEKCLVTVGHKVMTDHSSYQNGGKWLLTVTQGYSRSLGVCVCKQLMTIINYACLENVIRVVRSVW